MCVVSRLSVRRQPTSLDGVQRNCSVEGDNLKNDNVVGWAPNRQAIFSQLSLGPSNVFTDWMHCAHIGIYQYIFGSILSILPDRVPGESKEKRRVALSAEIRGF